MFPFLEHDHDCNCHKCTPTTSICYIGPPLVNSGIDNNDNLSIALQKLDNILSITTTSTTTNSSTTTTSSSSSSTTTTSTTSSERDYLEKTKSEIDALIISNGLIPSTLYKISGAHPTLYDDGTTSGTTIYLQALTTNILAKEGHGEFYNPKYDQNIDGFGIWSNRSAWVSTIGSGIFNANELITGNGGQTGQLVATLDGNIFITLTGDWTIVTSITGQTTGATATVASIVLKTYSTSNKVIWGGYSWTNVNGLVGTSTDVLILSTEWSKDTYDEVNYNKVLDPIEYDFLNDEIVMRREVIGNNTVITSKENNDYLVGQYSLNYSPISVFMWGNINLTTPYKGISNNICNTGYFECINFQGTYVDSNIIETNGLFYNNLIIGLSYVYTLVINDYSYIMGNTLIDSFLYASQLVDYSGIYDNNLVSCYFHSNALNESNIYSNVLSGGSAIYSNVLSSRSAIYSNVLSGGAIYSNVLSNNSNIYSNVLSGGSAIYSNVLSSSSSAIYSNVLSSSSIIYFNALSNNSNIYSNVLSNGSTIYFNALSNNSNIYSNVLSSSSAIYSNVLSNGRITIGTSYPLITKTIQYLTMESAIINVDVTAATIIYADYPKTVYKRPDGVIKLRYYNNSDVLVIANVTD